MGTISFNTQELGRELRTAGLPQEQAEAVVRTIVKSHADLSTKGDLRDLELKLDAKFTALDGRITLLQWMLGLLLAGVASLVIKGFF
jgi:hypothetical protein